VSRESQEILDQALAGYPAAGEEALRAAAIGHLGASRPLSELLAEYARALENGTPQQAQALADEMEPVRTAALIAAGDLPRTGA
jgi:hypothetical protein